MQAKMIKHGSSEWREARQLRYKLFFKDTPHDESIMDDYYERESKHLAIIKNTVLIAYGRLSQIESKEYIISQMVVEPNFQSKGFGTKIIEYMLQMVGNSTVILSSRLTAISFYKKFGFNVVGKEFITESTGVAHIKMVRNKHA